MVFERELAEMWSVHEIAVAAVGIVAVEDTVVAVAGTVVVKAGSLIIVAGTATEVDITIAFINSGTIAVVVKLDSVKGDTFEVKKE